jgi:protein involved in polysaccharide export with SLBB domain
VSLLTYIRSLSAIVALLSLLFPSMLAAQDSRVSSGRGANSVLQPGDLVRLKIWREPDLSGDYRVDEDGVAIFPKIGPLQVSRLSTDSFRSLLVSSYDRYLQSPSIEVTFLRRINVLGEVKNPGLYDVDPTMSVADVLAMAGGVSPDGDPTKIELLRRGDRLSAKLSPQSRLIDAPLTSGDQLRVPQRSWLARNGSVVAAGITAAALITTAVIRP